MAAEIGLGAEAIARATGVVTDCLRPAYGIVGPRINGLVLGSGHAVVMWDRDSGDWDHQSARAAVGRVIGSMKAGDVILMHDSVGWVARDALPLIIEEALRRGLGFDTLCDDRPPQRAGERSLTWSNALGLRA